MNNVGEFVISLVLSLQQKFEETDGPELQPSDGPVLQLHVTAQFHLESKGKYLFEV